MSVTHDRFTIDNPVAGFIEAHRNGLTVGHNPYRGGWQQDAWGDGFSDESEGVPAALRAARGRKGEG